MAYSLRWKELKRQAWIRAQGHCEFCSVMLRRGSWHLHHLTYERRGHELLEDLRAICLECHGKEHPRCTFRPVAEQLLIAKRRKQQGLTRRKKKKKETVKGFVLTAESRKARYQSAGRKFG